MIRKIMILALKVSFVAMTTCAFAEEVFVTQKGAKYHKATCRLIKNKEVTAMEKDKAVENDYTPCKRCFKEDVVTEAQESNQEKK